MLWALPFTANDAVECNKRLGMSFDLAPIHEACALWYEQPVPLR